MAMRAKTFTLLALFVVSLQPFVGFTKPEKNTETTKIMETKAKGKAVVINYISENNKQALTINLAGKEVYRFVANPAEASMYQHKIVKFNNYPREVLVSHWLLGNKNQRLMVFDFNDTDSPLIFDIHSSDEISYKILNNKMEITYTTNPNHLDAMEYSEQKVVWTPGT